MKPSLIAICSTAICICSTAFAWPQHAPAPSKQHKVLQKFAGEWVLQSKMEAVPGQPAFECSGTMNSRMLGQYWAISEVTGEMPGGVQVTAMQTLGYDEKSNRFIGTWVDSMLNYMWHYEGTVNDSGTKLTLKAEGPNFVAAGKITKFRDTYEFKSADHIVLTSAMLNDDGTWVEFMTGNYRRKK